MRVVAIIPARGGSKRIPKKNLRKFKGQPLIAWSINAAKSCSKITDVIVSTDSVDISTEAENYGAKVLMRPKSLADDFTSAYNVMEHIYHEQMDSKPEYLLILQPTSPLRESDLLEKGINMIQQDESIDRVIEVNSLRLFSGDVVDNLWIPDYPEDKRSQDISETFFPSGRLYVYRSKTTVEESQPEGRTMVIKGNFEQNINIDYESDFEKLDFVYKKYESKYKYLLGVKE
jgi:CMP-N-acetylneuraminic acid synthetase